MKTLRRNIRFFSLLLAIAFLFGCGTGETGGSKDTGGSVTIQSQSFPEIQGMVSKVVAYLEEVVAGFSCPLTVDSDTTLSGQCSGIPNGTHTYTLKYVHTDTGAILATTLVAATMEQGQNHELSFPALSKNYDDDGDGYTNIVELVNGSNPKDNNSVPSSIDNTPPATPGLLSPTAGSSTSDNTPAFDWSDVTDPSVVSYEIQVDNSSDFSSQVEINQVGLTVSNYTSTTSLSDGTYYWRVRARDGSSNVASDGYPGNPSAWSAPWIITINTGNFPSAPTGVTANAGDGQATISWNTVSGATSYNIYWSTTSGVTKTTGTKITGTISPYTHTGLTNGTTYYYVITAVNSYGESSESSPSVSATPQAVSTSGLIAYYPFSGNANDASGNGYNGTVNGAALTADRFGNANSAYSFNGTNNYISLSNTSALNFTSGGFSLAAWVNFTADNNDVMIIAKHIPYYGNGYFLGVGHTGYPSNVFNFFVDSDIRLKTAETYNDGKWHFVAGVYDGTTQYLYVDGVLKGSQQRTYSNTNNIDITIGGLVGNSYFNGLIDDVRIYSRAISDSEIQTIINSDTAYPSAPVGITTTAGDAQATIS